MPTEPGPPPAAAAMIDAYAPAQITERVRAIGVTKANLPAWDTLALAVLAGAFIALGAASRRSRRWVRRWVSALRA
jgi:hypothetical protein